jgi:hypothetical protein
MKGILRDMIFFRKKKPEAPSPKPAKPEPVKAVPVKPAKKPEPAVALAPEPKTIKTLQEIAHTRVLTAEGWRRSMEKKVQKKSK